MRCLSGSGCWVTKVVFEPTRYFCLSDQHSVRVAPPGLLLFLFDFSLGFPFAFAQGSPWAIFVPPSGRKCRNAAVAKAIRLERSPRIGCASPWAIFGAPSGSLSIADKAEDFGAISRGIQAVETGRGKGPGLLSFGGCFDEGSCVLLFAVAALTLPVSLPTIEASHVYFRAHHR